MTPHWILVGVEADIVAQTKQPSEANGSPLVRPGIDGDAAHRKITSAAMAAINSQELLPPESADVTSEASAVTPPVGEIDAGGGVQSSVYALRCCPPYFEP